MWECASAQVARNRLASIASAHEECECRDNRRAKSQKRVAEANGRAMCVNQNQDPAHKPQQAEWRNEQNARFSSAIANHGK
jgi:hypothetical protein